MYEKHLFMPNIFFNQVYCPTTDECVEAEDANSCICGIGMIYCNGRCRKSCSVRVTSSKK